MAGILGAAGPAFLRCPFFANTDGALKENRVCALPGRLTLELTQSGGRFAQSWLTFSEGWVPLPGNLDNWPAEVSVNGAPGAVVSREGIPQLYAAAGTLNVVGQFHWAIVRVAGYPRSGRLISLTVTVKKSSNSTALMMRSGWASIATRKWRNKWKCRFIGC